MAGPLHIQHTASTVGPYNPHGYRRLGATPPPPSIVRRTASLGLQLGLPLAITCTSLANFASHATVPQPAPSLLQRIFSSSAAAAGPVYRHPALRRILTANFVLSFENVAERRWWAMALSALNHDTPRHLLSNLLALVPLTRCVADPAFEISPLDASAVAAGAALACSAATLYLTDPHRIFDVRAMGASGVVHGLLVYVACMAPRGTWLAVPVLPVSAPASLGAAVVVLSEVVMLIASRPRRWVPGRSVVGHAGHLGGAAFALAYYWVRHWRLRPRSWTVEEPKKRAE
jgi:membrane associated rhomboid family serine protease